ERGERGERNNDRGGERADRGGERGGEGRRNRGERGERAERTPRPEAEAPVVETAAALDLAAAHDAPPAFVDSEAEHGEPAANAQSEERQGGRRRRRRGGRDRNAGAEGSTTELNEDGSPVEAGAEIAEAGESAAHDASADVAEAVSAPEGDDGEGQARDGRRRGRGRDRNRREPREAGADGQVESGDDGASAHASHDAPAADAATHAAPVAHAPEAVHAAPAVAEPVAAPVDVPRFELSVDSLHAIAGGAGLEWINSDAAKVAAAQAAIAAEPKPVHVPRERPPLVVVDEGPLVLVETRKDLNQIKLPFDAS
ncbi:MAG: ribonuclease E/G, partial [Pelomonas sp.]|nr:ribonuclease E/G [Roseateles sp.]